MKRTAFLTMMMAGTLAALADSYAYLTIEKTDGTSQSLTAVGLSISYTGSSLIATNGTESTTLALTDISRMYFSNEQTNTTGINAVSSPTTTTNSQTDGIYNLQGHRVASLSQRSTLSKGIYIIRENGQTKKIQVK